MPKGSQSRNTIKPMGDRSPKANQKKSTQKKVKAVTASQKKKAAEAAKSTVLKKK